MSEREKNIYDLHHDSGREWERDEIVEMILSELDRIQKSELSEKEPTISLAITLCLSRLVHQINLREKNKK